MMPPDTRVLFAAAVLLFGPAPVCPTAHAQITGDLELLKMLAEGIEFNVQSVLSWVGTATVSDMRTVEKSLRPESTASVTFAYDAVENRSRWSFDAVGAGGESDASARYVSGQILMNGEHYRFGPNYLHTADEPWTVYLDAIEGGRTEPLANEFDPLSFVRCVRSETIQKFLRQNYEELKDDPDFIGEDQLNIETDGSNIDVVFRFGKSVNQYTFDTAYGCNLTEFLAKSPGVEERWTFVYEMNSGVAVPEQWCYENVRNDADSTWTQFKRQVDIETITLNEPVSDEEFSLSKIGLRDGDFVQDNLRSVSYRFPPGYREVHSHSAPEHREGYQFLIWLNCGLILAVGLGVALRKYFSSPK